MTYAGWNYVGAEGQSYPEIAAREVARISAQNPSPFYGYLRMGTQQKIYLFPEIEQARGWFTVRLHAQPPYDYAAVFAATDLTRPVAGLESFGHTHVVLPPSEITPYTSGDAYVGNMWPFFLGLPLGGLAGYFLRRWQEENPGQALPFVPAGKLPAPKIPAAPGGAPISKDPKTSGDPYVGAPWLDIAGQDYGYGPAVGGPWLDMIGQDYGYGPAVGGPWLDMIGQDYGYGPAVGGPWLDMIGQDYGPVVGGPWLDMIGQDYSGYDDGGYSVGADDEARRRAWPTTKALIQSAIDDVTHEAASHPAAAYVWVLTPSGVAPYAGRAPGSVVTVESLTNIVPFTSPGLALDYLREVAQTRPVALAMFDRTSSHWPNPVSWRKSDDPAHGAVIAQHVASRSPTHTSGDYVGDEYVGWNTVIGSALDDVRGRARTLADKRAGNVIGVIHMSKDGLWHTLAFRSADDADDWLGTSTHDPSAYTYAAYFDKGDYSWPHPVNEKIGGARIPSRPGSPIRRDIAVTRGDVGDDAIGEAIGAVLDDVRNHAKALATARPGNAVGVIHSTGGLWSALPFGSLDEAIDWLQRSTHDKASFTYAAAFEKGSDGTAYFQQEEVGGARTPTPPGPPIPREPATTSGEWWVP